MKRVKLETQTFGNEFTISLKRVANKKGYGYTFLSHRVTKKEALRLAKSLLTFAVLSLLLFVPSLHAETAYYGKRDVPPSSPVLSGVEWITPPETSIGGALAVGSIVMVFAADLKRRTSDHTASSSRLRHTAINMAYASIGFISLGWLSASYYEKRFSLQTKIQF